MKLTWKSAGPAREPAIEVPDISIGNYGHVLVHDPKRKCIVYVRAKDYGGELEASTWNGTAWTRQQGRGRLEGDQTHGFFDTERGGVAMWSVEHDYKVDRIVPNGVLVTDGKIQTIKTKGDHPLIEPDSEESFYLSSSRGCAMAFDAARGVTVCLTRRGVWELDGAGVWTKCGEPSKHVPPDWHDDARGTWDPVGKRCVFWFQERGNGYKFWLAAWDGTTITKVSMKGLPNPLADMFEPYFTLCGHTKHGVVAQLGGKNGTWALAKDAWKRLPATGDVPPRIGGASGCGMPHLAFDSARDALMIGPGYHQGDSDAQRVFYELCKGAWRRLGAVNHRSPIESLGSSARHHAVVGDTWYSTSNSSLHTMQWIDGAWKEIVDEKTGEKLVGNDSLGAIAATPDGLVGVTQKGAVFRLEKGKYKQLAKATPVFKTRSDFLLAHDGTRLVAWGGEIKNRKANDTLTFDGKKWTAVKKTSPSPKWRTEDFFIDHTLVFDTKLARLVRFGYMEFAVFDADEWKPYKIPAYTALIGSRKWQHVPAHDPKTGETLLVDFESGKVVRFDLVKCEEIAKIDYPADRKKIAAREHESVHNYFSEDAVFIPATRTLESQHAPDSYGRYAVDLAPAFTAASKRKARALLATIVVALCACGSKATERQPEPGSAITKPAPPDAAVVVPAKPTKANDKPKPTKAQLAEFKKRMKAGWALQKATKWAESVPEFEAALVALPDDQRALSELGWSAMHAGDFVKARKADEAAIRVAVDKNVKAAGLYNLGQVQEKSGDKDGAQRSFQESLKLRPHPAVEKALAALGAKPGAEVPFCAAGKKPCDCIREHAFDENQQGTDATCAETNTPAMPVKTFKLYTVSSQAYHGSKWTYVLDEANQLVDIVEGEAERGRLFEKTTLEKADVKTIGGHWVLWLETTNRSDVMVPSPSEDDAMMTEEWTSKQLTICVIGDAKTPTRCPLRDVPLLQKTAKGSLDEAPKPSTTTETHLEVTIADDGVATVKLVKGPSDAQIGKLVGPHKLW